MSCRIPRTYLEERRSQCSGYRARESDDGRVAQDYKSSYVELPGAQGLAERCCRRDKRFVYMLVSKLGFHINVLLACIKIQTLTLKSQADKMTESSMPTASEVRTVTIQPLLATPTRSPSKRPIIITQVQKQALIDNLQLESLTFPSVRDWDWC